MSERIDFRQDVRIRSLDFEQRFWAKVRGDGAAACWEWIGSRDASGYGCLHVTRGKRDRAHRISYTLARGPIPAGMHLDHLCENTSCCNPWHLEAVSPMENTRRQARSRIARQRVECEYGHSLADAAVHTGADGSTRRFCRECRRVYCQAWRRLTGSERARRRAAGLPLVDLAVEFGKAVAS